MRAGLLLPALLLAFPVAGEAQVAMTAETVIRGVVFDSLNMRPLAEATVQIAAANVPKFSAGSQLKKAVN